MTSSIVYDGNDHVVSLTGLKDSDGTEVTTATVEMTLLDGGTEVSGITWPISLSHDSGGDYSAVLDKAVEVTVGKRYTLKVTATVGTTEAEWREWVVVKRRDFNS